MALDHNTEEGRNQRIRSMMVGDLEDAYRSLEQALGCDLLSADDRNQLTTAKIYISRVMKNQTNP
jgi:hypothetical protein